MANAPKATPATPPPLSAPPPVPVSGITPARKAIAPTLTDEPKGMNPEKVFADRTRAAIAKATGQTQQAQDDAAGEDAAPPPKAKAETPATKDSGAKSATSATAENPSSSAPKPTDESKKSSEGEGTERRYDLASLRKWAEKNPEEAAEVFQKLGHLAPDSRSEWIRLKNRERKLKDGLNQERERTVAEAKAERQAAEEAKAAIDGAVGKLAPIADLWEAVAEKIAASPDNPQIDFEAADAAFQENAKISIDDYMRLRARRAIGSGPDAVKLRAENARLKRELAGKPSDAIKPKAADAPTEKDAAGTAAPAAKVNGKEARDWSSELSGKHKLRGLEGWNALLDTEMRKHYDPDLDEYSADPDEVADKLMKREIERMMEDDSDGAPPPAAKPKAKPAATPKPTGQGKPRAEATPNERDLRPKLTESDGDDEAKVGGMTWAQRQSRAIDRAMKRARGELE